MSRWMQVLAVALAAVVGLVPAFAQLAYAQAVPAEQPLVVFPRGEELSDAELLDVDGDVGPFAKEAVERLVSAVVIGGIAVTGDLALQQYEIARGERSSLDPVRLSIVGLTGFTYGALSPFKGADTVAEKAIQTAHKVHGGLHTIHVGLHTYVRMPVQNAVTTVWNWIWRR